MHLLLTLLLVLQGIAIPRQAGGIVTGVLLRPDGSPAPGVRVSAMPKPDSADDILSTALSALAETDENGRYQIENVPPGQYYIVAGRVDFPTYYPGSPEIAGGRVIRIDPGATVSGLNFTVERDSVRLGATDIFQAPMAIANVAVRVTAEAGMRIPFLSPSGAVTVRFERSADDAMFQIPVTGTSATDFRVSVRNLPEGYVVKQIRLGDLDITSGALSIPSSVSASTLIALMGAARRSPALAVGDGISGFTVSVAPPAIPPLSILLGSTGIPSARPAKGVMVRGHGRPGDTQPVFLSGRPGIVFSDGTFEFRDVLPGVYGVATIDAPGREMGSAVVVGDRNIDSVVLREITAAPSDIQRATNPQPAGGLATGSAVPPVTLQGVVLEEKTRQPIPEERVYIAGRYDRPFPVDKNGRFVIKDLIPGVYILEIQVFGHSNVSKEVTVGVENMQIELTSQKLF
jgi:hypothetical protein